MDASGYISAGEFGKFMRIGEHVLRGEQELSWRKRMEMVNHANAREQRQERDKMFHRGIQKAMRDAPRMSTQEVRRMSEHFNARLVELCEEPSKRSWFKLFKFVDENDSGMICFNELQTMVRKQLGLPSSNVPERSLMALWVALDKDGSGLISAGEFGAFMRLGEGVSQVPRELNFEKRLKMAAGV